MTRGLGERGLSWIIRHEGEFAAGADAGTEAELVWFAKRNAEVGLLGAVLADAGHPEGRPLLSRAWDRFDAGEWLVKHAALPAVSAIYPPFWRHALRNATLEQGLVQNAALATAPPLRILLACSLAQCELVPPWSLDELLRHPVLGERPTWRVDANYAYLVMHAVWLLAPIGRLPEQLATYVRRSLPAWIHAFVRAGEIDLVAEGVMTAHVLGECVPEFEWQVVVDAQEEDGLVPFKAAWRNREAPPRARWEANYHSTIAATAAAAMCSHAEAR